MKDKKWVVGIDHNNFGPEKYTSKQEALEVGFAEMGGPYIYVGTISPVDRTQLFSPVDVIERMCESAYDQAGEASCDWPSEDAYLKLEATLQDTFDKWIEEEYPELPFFTVGDIERHGSDI